MALAHKTSDVLMDGDEPNMLSLSPKSDGRLTVNCFDRLQCVQKRICVQMPTF